MRKLILYVAASLDGFIAREDGSVDWLFTDQDYGYKEFIAGVDTVLVGRRTWEQAFGWFEKQPFGGGVTFVFSRKKNIASRVGENYVSGDLPGFIAGLKRKSGQSIWLMGGAQIIGICLSHGLIDRLMLHVHPVILGAGIPLFPHGGPTVDLDYLDSRAWETGLVKLDYALRNMHPA